MYLGVDIGGTFTDLVLMDDEGTLTTTKALSTPGQLQIGVFDAILQAAELRGMSADELMRRVTAFGHGTTQATNALIERDGAKTGLIATRGFGDTLALQRLMGFTAGVAADDSAGTAIDANRTRSCRGLWCARSPSASIRLATFSSRLTTTMSAAR
jgi:N-methylhydantoinase A